MSHYRNNHPAAISMTDKELIDALLKWEKQFEEIEIRKEKMLSRNILSALCFPTFNEFCQFQKSK